jgi:hypothetical protein
VDVAVQTATAFGQPGGLFVVSVAINAGNLVVPAKDGADLARLVKGINDVTTLVLVVIALITMVQVVVDVVRLVRSESA